MKKFEIIETDREDCPYNVQEWNSIDNGQTFFYTGKGQYCRTLKEIEDYIKRKEELGKDILIFVFKWENGSLNDNGTKILNNNGIDFHYHFDRLKADPYKLGLFLTVKYKPLGNDFFKMYFE